MIYSILTTATPTINSDLVTEVLGVCKNVMGLFTEFPLNVLLIVSVAASCFGLFRAARSAV